jgi:hypothetical protein
MMAILKGFPPSNSIAPGIIGYVTMSQSPIVYDPLFGPQAPKKKTRFFKKLVNSTLFMAQTKTMISDADKQTHRDIEQIAYFKWIDAGKPEGKSDEFWKQASEEYYFAESTSEFTGAYMEAIKGY